MSGPERTHHLSLLTEEGLTFHRFVLFVPGYEGKHSTVLPVCSAETDPGEESYEDDDDDDGKE